MSNPFYDNARDIPAMTYIPDMSKVLSAASYPQAAGETSTNRGARQEQLFGGLVLDTESTEDEDQDTSRPRKRSRSNKAENAKDNEPVQKAPKKQRGRPKVTTKDETAAERRRTQIRLAQRAYRNRKENTITDLTQKVENMQAVMRSLNQGFVRLRENLLSTGVVHANSSIARQVDDLLHKLSQGLDGPPSDAEKAATEDEDAGLDANDGAFDRVQNDMFQDQMGSTALQGQNIPVNVGPDTNNQSDLLDFGADHGMLDLVGQNLTDFQNQKASPTNFHTFFDFRVKLPPTVDLGTPLPDPSLFPVIERFPHKRVYTYSFQETTFARRLHRLCIEQAYRKITKPQVDTDWLLRTFRFTLHFTNRERMVAAFKVILSRNTDESLENFKVPYFHIGGAGLHFPRRDLEGNPIYPPNLADPAIAAAPFRIPNTELIPAPSESIEDILERIGYGGEWFDSHDVEEYLRTKGIYPTAQSSFVTVDSALINSPPAMASTISSASSPQSNFSGEKSYTQELTQPRIVDTDQVVDHTHTGAYSSITDWLNQHELPQGDKVDLEFADPATQTGSEPRRLLTIEVDTFLQRLAEQSVCLGRAPGFRRDHVDNALSMALQEAF